MTTNNSTSFTFLLFCFLPTAYVVWGKVIFSQASVILVRPPQTIHPPRPDTPLTPDTPSDQTLPQRPDTPSHQTPPPRPDTPLIPDTPLRPDTPPHPPPPGYAKLRSTGGGYASYWNAFMFYKKLLYSPEISGQVFFYNDFHQEYLDLHEI